MFKTKKFPTKSSTQKIQLLQGLRTLFNIKIAYYYGYYLNIYSVL